MIRGVFLFRAGMTRNRTSHLPSGLEVTFTLLLTLLAAEVAFGGYVLALILFGS